MPLRESSVAAAKIVTRGVTAVFVCLFLVPATSTARAEEAPAPGSLEKSPEGEPKALVPTEMIPEAKVHYERGLQLYSSRDFVAAIKELELGFNVEPRREFLFAQAQAFRLAGDCAHALPLYRRFLDSDPSPLQAEAARLGLDRCGPNRSSQAPPVAQTTPPPAPSWRSTSAPDQRDWWRDPWAALSIGTGIAALATGVGFEIASANARDDARALRPKSYPEFDRLWESAQQRRLIAVTTVAGGAALLVAGGVRLIVLHRRSLAVEPPRNGLSFVPTHGGGTLTWRGGF